MKKVLALALALVMMMAIAIPAFAAEETQVLSKVEDSVDQLGTGTDIKYGVTQAYTITIPADVTFTEGADHEAGDDLTAQRDARIRKPFHIGEYLTCSLVVHHFDTKLSVCGVNRNVDGGDVHINDTVNILVL